MKKLSFLAAAAIVAVGSVTHAQVVNTTLLDAFDTNTVSEWTITNGSPSVHASTDSQSGSGGSIQFVDLGFSYSAAKTYTGQITTEAPYRTTFYYKNGPDTDPSAANGLFERVSLQMNGVNVTGQFIGLDPVENLVWTQVVSDSTVLPVGDLTLTYVAANGGTPVPGPSLTMQVDEITLEELEPAPSLDRVVPLETAQIDETQTISVFVSGGSGTFSTAEFDVSADSSIEFTDSDDSDGFNFDFDTTALADGPVTIADRKSVV